MSRHVKFWVFDHRGNFLCCRDEVKDAVALAKRSASLSGKFGEVWKCPGGKRKRFYANGRVCTMPRAQK